MYMKHRNTHAKTTTIIHESGAIFDDQKHLAPFTRIEYIWQNILPGKMDPKHNSVDPGEKGIPFYIIILQVHWIVLSTV